MGSVDHSESLTVADVDVRLVAFYLPQFHPIPENDQWWGKGFTEWRNVTRARPQFAGHYQPRRPADLGYYDLRVPEVRQQQAQLARQYGIHGFCYYYYWFNGKKLLERPLHEVLASGSPDFPFCICWANENWTRAWDGQNRDILIAQKHSAKSDTAFLRDVIPILRDRRYMRVNGAPLLVVYRPTLLPSPTATMDRWRRMAEAEGVGPIHLAGTTAFDFSDAASCGLDSLVEFPPHLYRTEDHRQAILGPESRFAGHLRLYEDVVEEALRREWTEQRVFRGVMVDWDNTARRGAHSTIYWGGSPETYESWLREMIARTRRDRPREERLVFINAWNEWAEGAYLEPDEKWNHQYLEATLRALRPAGSSPGKHPPALDGMSRRREILAAADGGSDREGLPLVGPDLEETCSRLMARCANLTRELSAAQTGLSPPVGRNLNEEILWMRNSIFWRLRQRLVTIPGLRRIAEWMAERRGAVQRSEVEK